MLHIQPPAYEEEGKAIDPKGFITAYLHNRDALKFVSFSSEDPTHGYFEVDPALVAEERHVKNLIVTNASKFMSKRMRPNTALANPTAAPTLTTATTGGFLPATTYYVTYTWVNANGETLVSPEASIVTTGATSTVTVNLPALPAGATSINVYFGTATGTGTRQGSTTTTLYVQSAALSTQAPAANTSTISNPTAAPTLATATTGGSLAAATYYVKYTWVNAQGETQVSPEASIIVPAGTATNTVTVTLPALPAGATSTNVYVSTSTNTETKQGNTATTTYVQSAALSTTAPAANTGTIANPTAAPTLATATTGGSLAAATYFVKYTWVNANGETMVSPEASVVTTGTTSTVTATIPALPAGATSANVYISTATNAETKQGNTATTTYTQTAVLAAGAAVPVSNTCVISNPTAAPTLATATTGGSLAAATYYVKYTWVNANGETLASSEASIVVPAGTATNTVTATLPVLPAGATSINIYISTATNAETKQGNTTTTTFTQTAILLGTAVPASNTCAIANPAAAPTLATATTGGYLPAATYFVKYTWVNANGETMVSPEASIVTTGATSTVTATIPALPAGATSASVYMSTATNAETKQGNTTGTTFTQSSILLSGAVKPTVTTCTVTWGAGITHLEVGTGVGSGTTQAPQVENSAQQFLRVALWRKAITSWTCLDVNGAPTAADTNVLQLTTTFIEAEAIGAIVEMGLFGGDATITLSTGQMFNYKTFAVLNKDGTMQLTLVWKLTF